MRATRRALVGLLSLLLAATMILTGTPASAAASLVQVTDFGYNPTNLEMHLYVPDTVTRRPAVVVALHYCTGSGPVLHEGTPFASLADRFGFILIYPSATRASHCFDVSSPEALTHDGHSDPAGVVSMVRYVQRRFHADPHRVFATGYSSGAMMTNVLLGAYPDVFRAGAAFAGVPFACFATTDGSEWNSQCANGQISKTPPEWGDLVRAAFPGYRGPRPRMQLWHGTEDDILRYPNFGEEIKQWTEVSGLSQTPTSTDSPQPSWTRTRYADRFGRVAVEAVSLAGEGHNLLAVTPNILPASAIQFFGLSGPCPNGYVGLTYDDGPYPGFTLPLLDALRAGGARATFFIWGEHADANPELVRAIRSAGMWIGNHTYTHPHLTQIGEPAAFLEIARAHRTIRRISGINPTLFRPPFGETSDQVRADAARLGLAEVLWTVDSRDWAGASTAEIVAAAERLEPGGIILMHEGIQATIDAVPQILSGLSSRGLCPGKIVHNGQTAVAVAP